MDKKTLILFGFIILKFVLHYALISPEYDLHRDEYLHLDQAHHFAWGYLSVPPFTSWLSSIVYLLGNSVFWVKFLPGLFGALTIVVVWKTAEALHASLFALVLAATCVLLSALLKLNQLYQPNSFDVLSWTLFYFIIIKYFNSKKPIWLYAAAVVFAFGFLNKYNIAFLLIGLAPAILLTPHRKIFLEKHLYLAVLVGLVIVLPNLIWQYQNNFPVFYHLQLLSETQLVNVNRIDFLKSQLLFFAGAVFVILPGLIALRFYTPFRNYEPFFWCFIFTLGVFMYFKAKDYYAIGLYPVYIAFGTVFISHLIQEKWKFYLQPAAMAVPVLMFIPMLGIAFPNKSPEHIIADDASYRELGMLRWEDGKDHSLPQDFADMLGWKELATKVDSVYLTLSAAGKTLVLCDNYGQAGAINYYTRAGIKAVSFNADYIDWFELDEPYVNFIRIKEYDENETELKETSPHFETAVSAGAVTNPYAREYGTTIFAFTKAKVDVNERIRSEIERRNYFRK